MFGSACTWERPADKPIFWGGGSRLVAEAANQEALGGELQNEARKGRVGIGVCCLEGHTWVLHKAGGRKRVLCHVNQGGSFFIRVFLAS